MFSTWNCHDWKKWKEIVSNNQNGHRHHWASYQPLDSTIHCFSGHNHTNKNHIYNFKQAKKNLKTKELTIIEDLSENYSLKHQNNIMFAHWIQYKITLFCASTHYLKDGKILFNLEAVVRRCSVKKVFLEIS